MAKSNQGLTDQDEIRRAAKMRQKQQAGKGKTSNTVGSFLPREVKIRMQEEKIQAEKIQAEKIRREATLKHAKEEALRIGRAAMCWINYWKECAMKFGFYALESFPEEGPEITKAKNDLFNMEGKNDPRVGIDYYMGPGFAGTVSAFNLYVGYTVGTESEVELTDQEIIDSIASDYTGRLSIPDPASVKK